MIPTLDGKAIKDNFRGPNVHIYRVNAEDVDAFKALFDRGSYQYFPVYSPVQDFTDSVTIQKFKERQK